MLKYATQSSTRLAIGFAILAVTIVAAIGLSFGQDRSQRWVRHTLEVENHLANLTAGLEAAQAGQRAFVITGDESYLAPYLAATQGLPGELDRLGDVVKDNRRQVDALSRLRPLIDQRIAAMANGVALQRQQGFSAARAYIAEGRGKAVMAEINRQIRIMRAEEERLLALRQSELAGTRWSLRIALCLGLVGLLALTCYAVSDARRRFQLLRSSRDALAAANAELTTEAQARSWAESQVRQMQKMEAVGQLTGGIAHDFYNMLSVVIGSLELARRRLHIDPERTETCIANALEGAGRAADLTARLMAFSRQQALAPMPFDPNRLVGSMSEMLRRTLGEHVQVETVLAGGIWQVHADRTQLESAILNLCVNARDAMTAGGKLTIETSNTFLDEEYADGHVEVTVGQYVVISVTDTGTGMTPEVIERAFEPFYTTKAVGAGTGLGLSQVFGFVKQTGGHIKIYSEVGQGTTVKIYLPRWSGEAADETGALERPAPPRARDHEIILVVEDDEEVRTVTVDVLRELGYTVVHAATGEEGLRRLGAQGRVHLLVTDIIMPGMTGRAFADRALEIQPDLKVLFMTGYSRNAVIHNGVLDAGVAFLQKPFTTEKLAHKVRDVLEGRGANRAIPSVER